MKNQVFAGAVVGLGDSAWGSLSQVLETLVDLGCNMEEMGFLKAGAFLFPVCPMLHIEEMSRNSCVISPLALNVFMCTTLERDKTTCEGYH